MFSDSRPQISVVLFSGGRGASSISSALNRHSQVDLTVLVNAYDDGLSTGRIRAFIPGMLGPSDVRKNITALMPATEPAQRGLRTLLEYRLPVGVDRRFAVAQLGQFAGLKHVFALPPMAEAFEALSVRQLRWISRYCDLFLSYESERAAEGNPFEFSDCSIGNIIFAGCYLDAQRDFNVASEVLADHCGCRARILNVTAGENLVLIGIKDDGRLLANEAEIVAPQDPTPVSEIFLLSEYLSTDGLLNLRAAGVDVAIRHLRTIERYPESNPKALSALRSAEIIVYGPGTQY